MLKCSECGLKICSPNQKLPTGTVVSSKSDNFKMERVFCNQNHFDKFYRRHPEELPPENTINIDEKIKYHSLKHVLEEALEQAQYKKGKERHETDSKLFEEQHMCSIQRLIKNHPIGGLAFQTIKKVVESGVLYNQNKKEQAKQEILGAIIYAAGMLILLDEEE